MDQIEQMRAEQLVRRRQAQALDAGRCVKQEPPAIGLQDNVARIVRQQREQCGTLPRVEMHTHRRSPPGTIMAPCPHRLRDRQIENHSNQPQSVGTEDRTTRLILLTN
jgi:hypothetical protein